MKEFKGRDRHMQNFIDVVRSRKLADLYGPIAEGHVLAAVLAHSSPLGPEPVGSRSDHSGYLHACNLLSLRTRDDLCKDRLPAVSGQTRRRAQG